MTYPLKTLLLVIPRTFCVRAFLMTEFLDRLSSYSKVVILSPYGNNPEFVKRFKKRNVSFYELPDFIGYKKKHKRWSTFYSNIMNKKWDLMSKEIENELCLFVNGQTVSSMQVSFKSLIKKLLIFLIKDSSILMQYIANKVNRSFWETYELKEYEKLFSNIKPDFIISTKSAIWDEYPIARFGEKYEIPQITYVLSFDNITTNGVFPIVYDKWLVWNNINKNEVINQYQGVKDKDVTICGPLQFDFYTNHEKYIIKKEELFRKLELDISRPLLMLGAGPHLIAPQEPFTALQIAQSIRDSQIKFNCQLLIRLHPDDRLDRWQKVINDYPEVRFSLPWKFIKGSEKNLAIPTDYDIALLASTLFYSDVVINTSSSMALDAAVFDRPVVCLAFDESPGKLFDSLCKKLYEREHYIPIVESNGVAMAYTSDQTVDAINSYLSNPKKDRKERLKMLRLFDSFGDGKAGLRSANAVLDFMGVTT